MGQFEGLQPPIFNLEFMRDFHFLRHFALPKFAWLNWLSKLTKKNWNQTNLFKNINCNMNRVIYNSFSLINMLLFEDFGPKFNCRVSQSPPGVPVEDSSKSP